MSENLFSNKSSIHGMLTSVFTRLFKCFLNTLTMGIMADVHAAFFSEMAQVISSTGDKTLLAKSNWAEVRTGIHVEPSDP